MGRTVRLAPEVILVVGVLAWVGGCGSVPALPASFEVATSATDRVAADAGTGPSRLADSTWSLSRKADPSDAEPSDDPASSPPGPYGGLLDGRGLERPAIGEQMFLASFGAAGKLIGITENQFFLTEFYGSDIPVGGEWNATTLPGVDFQSEAFGTQLDDRFGLALVAHVRFGNFLLAQAVLYSWGTAADDRLDATFGYVLDFTDGWLRPLGTMADQFPVQGQRVTP